MSCVFTVELESKRYVKNISISDVAFDKVFFEGDLGKILELSILDSRALEILGENGALRIEVDANTLYRIFESPNQTLSLSSRVGSDTILNRKDE